MKKILHNKILLSITKSICEAVKKQFSHAINEEDVYSLFSTPPSDKLGQLAFPCFSFAKTLRMGPPQISGKIAEELENSKNPYIRKINPTGPYLNFELNIYEIGKNVFNEILSGDFFTKEL